MVRGGIGRRWAAGVGLVAGMLLVPFGIAASASEAQPGEREHYALNHDTADAATLADLGYTIADTGADVDDATLAEFDALGMRAMIWLPSVQKDTCPDDPSDVPWPEFTATVDRLGQDPRVFGYFIADVPELWDCPAKVTELRRRVDYIHEHSDGQQAYLVTSDVHAGNYQGSVDSGADIIGVIGYPCLLDGPCDYANLLDAAVQEAIDHGIDPSVIAPQIQVFGQDCSQGERKYRLPDAGELRTILEHWRQLVPDAPMDVSYSWGHQTDWSCPTLADANGQDGYPDLQSVMAEHNQVR